MNLKTGVSRKQSTLNFPKNEHFLPPDVYTYVWVSGGKNFSFFGKFGVLSFLETPVWRFVLLPYYQRMYSRYYQYTLKFLRNYSLKVLTAFLKEKRLLNSKQARFTSNDSCINQLTSINDNVFNSFDANPSLEVRGSWSFLRFI